MGKETQNKELNKKRWLLRAALIIFVVLVGVCILDIFLNKNEWIAFIFKISEALLSVSGAVTISVSFSVNVNVSKSENNNEVNGLTISNSNGINIGSLNIFSGDNPLIEGNNIGPGMKDFITVYKEILLPYQRENMKEIAELTFKEMSNNENKINKEFVLKYIEESKNISDKDIQEIWVKLLAFETKNENSVSKRTLDIIKNMTSGEAKVFQKIAELSLDFKNIIPKCFGNDLVDWNSISLLQDIGLVKSGDFTIHTLNLNEKHTLFCKSKNYVLSLNLNVVENTYFKVDCFVLTSEGLQLRNALGISFSDVNLYLFGRKLMEEVTNKNIQVGISRIVNIDADGQIRYSSFNELTQKEL